MPKKINSRSKGVKGEHEVRDLFRARGYVAKRGQQHEGGSDSPDVMSPIPWLHVEVKRTEALSLYKAMMQADEDAGSEQIPTVWHRRSDRPWLVVMLAEDFLDLIEGHIDTPFFKDDNQANRGPNA